jgi:hypothetical protein
MIIPSLSPGKEVERLMIIKRLGAAAAAAGGVWLLLLLHVAVAVAVAGAGATLMTDRFLAIMHILQGPGGQESGRMGSGDRCLICPNQ